MGDLISGTGTVVNESIGGISGFATNVGEGSIMGAVFLITLMVLGAVYFVFFRTKVREE